MNADLFEAYFKALCTWCKDKYAGKKVVFCMDNAKYHRREYQGVSDQEVDADTETNTRQIRIVEDYIALNHGNRRGKLADKPAQKSLSSMNKPELVARLVRLLGSKFPALTIETLTKQLGTYKKQELYDLAKKPENALPLGTEIIAN
ncbi:hypothetical protein BGX28_002349, partial [Mortierella sp. GBA30]